MTSCLPAHKTKHLQSLIYPFSPNTHLILAQPFDPSTTGSALWLSAQCLALYLAHFHKPKVFQAHAVDLGAGIGLTSLVLASLGWSVLATDIEPVLSTALSQNIRSNIINLPEGSASCTPYLLDWTATQEQWKLPEDFGPGQPLDLIISADTVYDPSLIHPLLRTIHTLCSNSPRNPTVLLCLERRDPGLVDSLLAMAKFEWSFDVQRVPHRKLAKAMAKGCVRWDAEDWESIELWKLSLLQLTPRV